MGVAAAFTPSARAQAPRLVYLDKLPPLIEREIFFDDPEYAGAQISPDGRHISFLKTHVGQLNIWVKRTQEPLAMARPITADSTRPVTGYFWSQDGKYVLYVQDKAGDENFHLYAVDPTAALAQDAKVPHARDLTPYGAIQAQLAAVPKKTPGQILVALNDRDARKHDLYRIEIATGQRELVFRNDENIISWLVDLSGGLRLVSRVAAGGGGTEVLRVDGDKLTPLFTLTCDLFRSCLPIRFHKDGRRVYVITAGPGDDLTHLALYDLESAEWERVESDPEKQVDFDGAEFSEATDELVATYYVGDRLRIYPKDPQFTKDLKTVAKAVGDGDVHFGRSTRDDRLHIITVTSDVDPAATYLYDRARGKVDLLYRPRPKLPREQLACMQPVRYQARDGLEIPAYLTIPKGVAPKNLAVVILPHGGPWGRDSWGYHGIAQFLANRGYAVLQPNFRGSTGYGQRFLDAGDREWGTGFMQHDLTDGAKWLVQQGVADAKRVAIMGGSYGGYATLAGMAFTPDLYAAGVSIVGPSSIPTLLASVPPYWEAFKRTFDRRVGDPAKPEDLARLEAQSPLYSARNIQAPLLVIQGANDPRVKKTESDQIVIALRELGRAVEYLVAPDEGHGFAGRVNRMAMFAAIEPFLARHLGGRYQESMREEVRSRVAAITVDPATVKLETLATKAAAAPATFNGDAVQPATLRYAQTIQVMGRVVEERSTVTVAAGNLRGSPVWVVAEMSQSQMGAGTDTVFVDRKTLAPLRWTARQGAAHVELAFRGDSVVGSIQAGPQEMPIRVKVQVPVFLDGRSLGLALSTLPPIPGYAASLRTFDLLGGSTREQRLEVTGTERVKIGAGEFDAYKVEVRAADGSPGGGTYWIERDAPRRVLKAELQLPAQTGGGTAKLELVEAK
ncbi:MAG: alpha/beta fold hydrolase [Gemmatimonadetes bacterium]|nr:alpha/beta fold hydrolase [Gemmatimonadota bacterium]